MSAQSESQRLDDLHATLAISAEEAHTGTSRVLTLPDGRRLPMRLPAGIQSGQRISFAGLGRRREDGSYGSLHLTITVLPGPPATPSAPDLLEEEVPTLLSSQPGQRAAPASPIIPKLPPGSPPVSTPQGPAPGLASQPSAPSPGSQRRWSRPHTLLITALAIGLLLASSLGFLVEQHQQPCWLLANATATSGALTAAAATRQAAWRTSTVTQATTAAQATASTIAAYPNPYPPGGGRLILYTPLSDPRNSIGWETGRHCAFQAGAYHVMAQDPRFFEACSNGIGYSDFVLEVEMTIVKGDQGGLLFRGDIDNDRYYLFQTDTSGFCSLFAYTGGDGDQAEELSRSIAIGFQRGHSASNLLALVVRGSSLTLYLNHEPVIKVTDGRYRAGQLALLAVPFVESGQATEVTYRHLKVWTF
ncbi:hypothetical protein [Thermogemmatispora sp.]|uniref:hypothetical protein n=1 Tax=Thermogemmatispora sp. TaxID=1968838 RepID=UPI002ACC2983|nr:hypothetical protein [Thermogemmatispora sp.]